MGTEKGTKKELKSTYRSYINIETTFKGIPCALIPSSLTFNLLNKR